MIGSSLSGGSPTSAPKPAATFYSQSFPPETHAGANRAYAIAEALATEFDVTVVAPAPSHPHPDRFAGDDVATVDDGYPFTVIRTRPFRPHHAGYVRRGMREMAMAAGLVARRVPRPDLVVATSPSFFLGPLALAASRFRRADFAWDLRDLTWIYAKEGLDKGGSRASIRLAAAHAITAAAEHTLRRARVVIASNPGIRTEVQPARPGKEVIEAPNGVDRAIHNDLQPVSWATPSNERIRVTYAGALGYFQALDSLLDAAGVLPEIDFTLVGDGPERARLEAKAANDGLTNVQFSGYVDRTTLYSHYASSDILFAQLRDLPVMARATFPSKLFEYLAAGRPIVYAGNGIAAEFLRSTDTGLIASPEDAETIRQSIAKLAGDSGLRLDMAMRARRVSDQHIRQDVAKRVAVSLRRSISSAHAEAPRTGAFARRMWKG